MNKNALKEKLRKEILNCNSSAVKGYDLSLFDDNDVDVFEKIVYFDTYSTHYYSKLSDTLKNNKNIVLNAVRCSSNIPFIPTYFFEDKDVIKAILHSRNEKEIPTEFLTEEMVNYMFLTCPRCSKDIIPFIDKFLKKESVIQVLKKHNDFFSNCIKNNSHPCIDDIHIPPEMFNDIDIVKLLFISHFRMVKENPLITKQIILEMISSNNVIENLPQKFFNDFELIKLCISKEYNYKIFDDYYLNKELQKTDLTDDLHKELIKINPNILKNFRFQISFEIFNDLINKDKKNLFYCSNISDKDEEKLYNFITSEKMLKIFQNEDDSYDFSLLYKTTHYYKNPIVDNQFIIEEMAKQDKVLFNNISKILVNNNELMYKLFFEYNIIYNSNEENIEELDYKSSHFGSFDNYLKNLELEHNLNNNLSPKNKDKKIKI